MKRFPRRFLRRTLLSLLIAVALLSLLEWLAGFGLPNTLPPASRIVNRIHPTRGWMPLAGQRKRLPSGVFVSLNALGYRDAELGPKPPGGRRILFLGDSVTAGFEVEEADTFVRRLGARFSGSRVACVNAGVWGYAPWQEAALLAEDFEAVRPDAVVLVFCANDVAGVLPQRKGRIPGWLCPAAEILYRSNLYRRLVHRREEGIRGEAAVEAGADPLAKRLADPTERLYWSALWGPSAKPDWGRTAADIATVARFCAGKGIPFHCAVVPVRLQCRDGAFRTDAERDLPLRRLAAEPALSGLRWIDLRGPLCAAGGESLFLDHTHFNPAGHAAVAEALAAPLRASGILGR